MESAINNLRDKSMSRLTVYKHLNLVLESPQKDINKSEVDVLFDIFHGDLLQGTQNGVNSLILNSIKLIVDEIKDDVAYSESLKNITMTVFKHLIAIVRFPQVQANHKTCWEMISSLSDSILKSVMDSNAKQIATFISQSLNGAIDKTVKILIAKVLLRWLKTSTKEEFPRIVADCQNAWFGYTVSTMFLSDENQKLNIETMELVLPHLRNLDYVNNPKWTAVMSDLQKKKYTPILLQLYHAKNIVWRSLWCIMLRLLEKDLKKNGLLINSLLPILEHAFRDETTRKDAFFCWKVLVEVSTSRTDEPNNPKVVKLLNTPLITNNAKSADMAIVKFDVWWTLITKISDELSSNLNNLYPFINYCFGDSSENQSLIPGLVFPSLQPYTIKSLVELFGHEASCTDCVGDVVLHLNKPVLNNIIFDSANKRWLDVVKAAIVIISEHMMNAIENKQSTDDLRQNVKCIWTSLLKIVTNIVNPNLMIITFENIVKILYSFCEDNKTNTCLLELLVEYLIPSLVAKDTGYSEEFLMDTSNYNTIENISPIRALMLFYLSPKLQACTIPEMNVLPFNDFVRIELDRSTTDFFSWILVYLKNTEPSITIWCAMSNALTNPKYSHINDIYDRVLVWPLDTGIHCKEVPKVALYWSELYMFVAQKVLTPKKKKLNFDDQLIAKIEKASQGLAESKVVLCSYFISNIVKQRLKHNSVSQVTYLPKLLGLIQELLCQLRRYDSIESMDTVIEIVDCVSCALASYSSRKSTPEYLQLLKKTAEVSLKTTHTCLQKTLLSSKLPSYSTRLAELFPPFLSNTFSKSCCPTVSDIIFAILKKNEEHVTYFKDVLQLVYKSESPSSTAGKKLHKIIKDNGDFKSPLHKTDGKGKAAKSDTNTDDFVIIKPNWKFDPKKLTEHQKEILTRRRENIPALYEDLSQSQDDYNMTGWKPAGYANDETSESSKEKSSSKDCTVRNDNHKSNPTESTDERDKDESVDPRNPNDTTVKKVLRDILNPSLTDATNNSSLQNGDNKSNNNNKMQKGKIDENVENDILKLNIVASPKIVKGSFQSRLERSIKKLQEGSVNLTDPKTASSKNLDIVSPVRIIKVVQLSPKPDFNVTPKSKKFTDLGNIQASTPLSKNTTETPAEKSEHDNVVSLISNKSADSLRPNCDISSGSVRPDCDNIDDSVRPICDTFNESVRPNGDISNDHARPNCNISDDHARPNCDISNDHARPNCNSSNDHAGLNCDISDDHDRLNCDISDDNARPNCDVYSASVKPSCDISNNHAGPNCDIYSASVKPSCDISNESDMLNEGKQVEKNEVTTPSAKKVHNAKIDSTPTSYHENISLKLNITPTADTVQMLPESERPIRKRKRPNKFDPDDLRFIGKKRASTSMIDHLRGSFSSDVDESSETSSVSSEVSSSQSKNEEDDTTPAKIKKRKLRLLKALAIDTVDGHPSKNMFDYDKPICRRSMTGGTNEPEIKRRRISISSEPKPKQKKTKIDKTKKRVQEVVDLESSDDVLPSFETATISQCDDVTSSQEKQKSACEIITITESQPTVIVDHVMKPVDESIVIIDHTQNTLVEESVTVELSESPIEIIDQTPKNIVQEKTDTLELFDESVVEVLGEEDPVCQSITDSSKSVDLIQSTLKSTVEISNQAVIEVVDDKDTVCQENTALPESEDVIQSSQESDSNISMTQRRISKIFSRKSRSPKVTDDKNESVTNYYVVIPDTQIDSTADMVTLPVYDESLSEKEVADKSTEAVQLSASKTVETAEVDTEMLDVETQILEEKKDVALFKDSVTVDRTSEVLVKDDIEIGTYVSKDEADLNMKDEEFPAENVIDVFDCKNECTDDDDQTNRSTIISSPYRDDIDDRNADLLNRTLDISPIKSVEKEDRMEIENDDFESLGCKVLSDESCSDTDQANSPCDSKTSSPVRTAESPLKTVSPPASDKVVPSENQSPPRGIYSPTSSMNQKRNRPLASRVGGRAAQMLGMCKRGFDGSDNKFSNVTSLSPVRMIARKNLHSFYGSGVSNDAADGNSEDENMLEFTKSLPSPYASPSVPILKRLQDDQTLSPSGKKKRVSFHDPPVSKQLSIEKYIDPPPVVRSPQRIKVIKNYKDEPASFMKQPKVVYCLAKKIDSIEPSVSPPKDTQHNETNLSEICSLEAESQPPIDLINNSLLDDTHPIYPSLCDCQISISEIASDLTSELCKNMFLQEIKDSICTIGDLAKLTELRVNRLPIACPKIQTVKRVLSEYESTLQTLTEDMTLTESQLNVVNDAVASEQMDVDTPVCDDGVVVEESSSPSKISESAVQSSDCIESVAEITEVNTCSTDHVGDSDYVNDANRAINLMSDTDKILILKEILKHDAASNYLLENLFDFISVVRKK